MLAVASAARLRRGWSHAGRVLARTGVRTFASQDAPLPPGVLRLLERMPHVPMSATRNFCIIAHIDHGKSTLSDKILEATQCITLDPAHRQVLDNLQVERERGITVRAQSASMIYDDERTKTPYLLNLVDTPGHVDFSYEVRRALAACQGAVLLVDASQGIQAQTLAHYQAALEAGLEIIPVLSKVDLPHAEPENVIKQMQATIGVQPHEVLLTSAKSGIGVKELFHAIVDRLPPPVGDLNAPARALLYDSWYDDFRGVVSLVCVKDGVLRPKDPLFFMHRGIQAEVQDLGVVTPTRHAVTELRAGQVGFVVTGVRGASDARVGETICHLAAKDSVQRLPGFQNMKPMVFASLYPADMSDYSELHRAVERLTLNDASVSVARESSGALGMGLRCGFLGLLHMDVFHQRLLQEFDTPVIVTAPTVPFVAELEHGDEQHVEKPSDLPVGQHVKCYWEPMVMTTVIAPHQYVGALMRIFLDRRGMQEDVSYIDSQQVLMKFKLPWQEAATDLYDQIKSATAGYASFDYEHINPEPANLVRVDMLLNGKEVDALSFVCHRDKAQERGRTLALRLKNVIRRQQFEIVIQAAVGAKIYARERIPPYRKDVLIKSGKTVGGGDFSRKRKLLDKQRKGKQRMKTIGNVELSQDAFFSIMQR